MKILVTGAAGFIGGYLVAELLRRGHHVIGIDNLSKYGPTRHAHDTHPNYTLIVGDAGDRDLLHEQLQTCDHFVAGAARIGGIPYFHTYPYDLLVENERLTAAAADVAITTRNRIGGRLRKVTWISSSMVYENADVFPSKEGDELTIPPPTSSYGFQKLAVEYHARAAWQQYRLPYTIVRPFNCVGIGERRALGAPDIPSGNLRLAMSHVVPDLCQKILRGQDPVHILGDGRQTRCYTYGGDLACGIAEAVEQGAADLQDFNLSTEQVTTVRELAAKIWYRVHPHRPLRLAHDLPYPDDVRNRIPDVGKAKRLLGFTATTPLDTILYEVLPWVQAAIEQGEL